MRIYLFFLIIFLFFLSPCPGQVFHIYGTVQETFKKTPLSYVHLIINDGEKELFTDMDGRFEITSETPIKKIKFKHHLHREAEYYYSSKDTFPLNVNLNKYLPFFYEEETDSLTEALIENVLNNKKFNNIENLRSFSYNTYNKYIFSAEKVDRNNKTLETIDKLSRKLPFGLHELKDNQHFLILESVTHRNYLDPLHQNETVIGAKSSSINLPSLFIQTTHLQAFSIYEDYINIIGKNYISPLAKYTLDRYAFKIIDTAYVDKDTVYILKFNPQPKKYFLGTKGIVFINTKKYAVQYIIAGPALENKIDMKVIQSFGNYNNVWFPEKTRTVAIVDKFGTRQSKMIGTANTYFYNVDLNNKSLKKKSFNENVLEFKRYANERDPEFWKSERKEAFTESDSNTYLYYDSLVHKKTIEAVLKAGEQIYYGQIPFKSINIDLNKVVNHNLLEGYRLGFGAHTNDNHSERYSIGAYAGYGFGDEKPKYGGDFVFHIEKKIELDCKASYIHDVKEAGATAFSFENYQYSSEAIRKYLLRIMDYVDELDNSISIHPLKYFRLRLSLTNSHNRPSYLYYYKGLLHDSYNFTDLGLGFRYAYGEKNIRLINQNIPIQSKYPIAYFQFTKGINNLYGEYSYTKADVRIDYTIKKFLLGKTGIQMLAGITEGDIPYFKLYNLKGSLRQPSVVIHNSFETMRYNEFLADKYIAFFFSHQFGKIYIQKPKISPSFMIMHNMGWGGLKNPSNHQISLDRDFKTMEKGYYESGMFLDNIVVINLWGLRTGFGTGFFVRYGSYALPKINDNLVFKLSTNFLVD
jgi:hypothetical protein